MFLFLTKRKRVSDRIGIQFLFDLEYDSHKFRAVMSNLSSHGFGCSTDKKIEVGQTIAADVVVSCDEQCGRRRRDITFKEKAVVQWVKPNRTLSLRDYNFGCRFDNISKLTQAKLNTILVDA